MVVSIYREYWLVLEFQIISYQCHQFGQPGADGPPLLLISMVCGLPALLTPICVVPALLLSMAMPRALIFRSPTARTSWPDTLPRGLNAAKHARVYVPAPLKGIGARM